MKRKRKLKKKFIVFLSSYALFFVSYFTMTTLARYTTLLNKNGNISVAKWDVSIAGEDNQVLDTLYIGDSSSYGRYNLSVTSKSEVAINYSIIIKNVPTGVQIQVDDKNPCSEIDHIVTITDLERLDAGDNTRNHTLTILVPSGVEPFDTTELDIDVIFTQVNL